MADDVEAAAEHYRATASRTTSIPEWHYPTTRAARLKAELDASKVKNRALGPSIG
jgi:hypothetical protein